MSTENETNGVLAFAKDNWHWPAGIIGGGLVGNQLKRLVPEHWENVRAFLGFVGSVAGAALGLLGLGAARGDETITGILSKDTQDELQELTAEVVKTKDAFVAYVAEKYNATDDLASGIYTHLDGLNADGSAGAELDGEIELPLTQIPQAIRDHLQASR